MSYILEALKKSQKDRDLGKIPDLTTEPYTEPAESRSGVKLWLIGSVIIALMALLIALYGVFKRQPPASAAIEIQPKFSVAEQLQTVEAVNNQIEIPTQLPKLVPSADPVVTPEPLVTDKPEAPGPATPAEKKVAVQAVEKEVSVVSSRQSEVDKIRLEYTQMLADEKKRAQEKQLATAAPAKKAYPAPHKLPAEVQNRMPASNIMLQSYSEDPAQRFVILNSVKLYQGERSADGLQVLEIRADGLLLEFEGHKFFLPR